MGGPEFCNAYLRTRIFLEKMRQPIFEKGCREPLKRGDEHVLKIALEKQPLKRGPLKRGGAAPLRMGEEHVSKINT